jgi:hypothetical protein
MVELLKTSCQQTDLRGQSHKGNNKGIPIWLKGVKEYSAQEMDNLGKDNFIK